MTELQESLFRAMQEINNYGVKHTDMNITIICNITKVVNSSQGVYTCQFLDKYITAYSDAATYSVGDIVYIVVPNGDFSENKFILGKKRS